MKSNNRWFIVLTVIIIGLVGCNIYLVVQNKNIHTNKEDNDVSEKPISNNDDKEEEKKLRRQIVEKALKALTTEVDGQTIFE